MTTDQIKAQMAKFNKTQIRTLREKFAGRDITSLHFDTDIDHVTVEFNSKVIHHFYLGPRGAMKHHTIQAA